LRFPRFSHLTVKTMTLLYAQAADVPHGVGLEWMPIASLIVPALLLVIVIYFGSRNTV
jgi:hypothetical protein